MGWFKIKLPKIDLRKTLGLYDIERKMRQEKLINAIGKELFRQLVEQNVKDETFKEILLADDPTEKAQEVLDDIFAEQK